MAPRLPSSSQPSPIADSTTLALAAQQLARYDPRLAPIIERVGPATISPHRNYYQALVRSIIAQQLSVKAAATITRRFVSLFDRTDFPTPELILAADLDYLRSAGLSHRKAGYIQDLAGKVITGTVRFDQLDVMANDAIVAQLTAVKGVGDWTVHMFLIFCMGRTDVLPVGDLGIKNGIQRLYGLSALPTADGIVRIARQNNWHPYESIASWYVWSSIDSEPIARID